MMIKLDEIIIPNKMSQSVPSKEKVSKARKYFITFGKIDKPIVIDENKVLIDGYIRYLVLNGFGVIQTDDVVVTSNSKVITYIYGKHPNQQSNKEYVWRVPKSEKWNKFRKNVEVGKKILCYTKYGIKPVIITRIVRSDYRPMDIPKDMKIKRIAKNQRI